MSKLSYCASFAIIHLLLVCHLYGTTLLGDCNKDGQLTQVDINLLSGFVSQGENTARADVDRTGSVDNDDVAFLEFYITLRERDEGEEECALLEILMGHRLASPKGIEKVIGGCTKIRPRTRLQTLSDLIRKYLERGGGSLNSGEYRLAIPARDVAALALAALYDGESRLLMQQSLSSEMRSRAYAIKSFTDNLDRLCRSQSNPVSGGTLSFVEKRTERVRQNLRSALSKPVNPSTAKPTIVDVPTTIVKKPTKTDLRDKKESTSNRGLIIGLLLIFIGGGVVGVAFLKLSPSPQQEVQPHSHIDTPLARANRYFSIKRYDKAIREYQKVLESPHLSDGTTVRLKLATAFTELGRYELATVHVEQLDLSQGSLDDSYALARTLEEHGQHDLAQRIFETICARRQDFKDVNKRLTELKERTEMINVFDPRVVERKFAPRYGTFSILGKGGMGVVFKARDRQDRKTVAIKVILPELSEEAKFRRRFDREIEALARLEHPAIVNVIASGKEPLYHYVMEFVEGRPVHDLIANRVLFQNYKGIGKLAQSLAEALSFAHRQGVLHRDIKPANIVMLPDNSIKLLDFGVARVADTTKLTVTGEFVGTLAYSAPELVYGAEASKACDVFSYGMVLFEVIANERPWSNEELMAGINRQAISVKDIAPECPENLANTVDACLKTNPRERLQDFEKVIQLLG